ncbi:MAG: DUF507 family protein [Candidatus Binatia bacterium]
MTMIIVIEVTAVPEDCQAGPVAVSRAVVIPSDHVIHRAATRLASALIDGKLLATKEAPAAVEKRIYEALKKNFQEEVAIEREAEKILEENKRQSAGMDQRALLSKIKEKLARERGFVL